LISEFRWYLENCPSPLPLVQGAFNHARAHSLSGSVLHRPTRSKHN